MTKLPAFTLGALLLVIAIIAILVSALLPALCKAEERTKLANYKSNMRQVAGVALPSIAGVVARLEWADAGCVHHLCYMQKLSSRVSYANRL